MKLKMCFEKNDNETFVCNEAFVSWKGRPTIILHGWFGESNEGDMWILKKMKRFIIRMECVEQARTEIMTEKEYLELFR